MRKENRLLLAILLLSSSLLGCAGSGAQKDPLAAEPGVTAHYDPETRITEYRKNGAVYAVKVTPEHGKPYFLVPPDGSSAGFTRPDSREMLIPQWEIFSW
ncbi:DUF2782 domain-containing protein [Pseudomonas sp. Pseusp122]|jgi:hypothetical protein|uniref:DUF2782 domain-containing protein n=1 Tax=unclassified Pseudomonas TaxID=196821 RepID=UPI0039A6059F